MIQNDKDSIGLTPANKDTLNRLVDLGLFSEGQDAAKFCMAYAIREKMGPKTSEGVVTEWAAGNFDKTGDIRALLSVLFPEVTTPIRLIENLVNEGLETVGSELASGRDVRQLL